MASLWLSFGLVVGGASIFFGSKQFLLHILHMFLYIFCIFCILFVCFWHNIDIRFQGAASGRPRILYYVKNIQKVYNKYKKYTKTYAKYVKEMFVDPKKKNWSPSPSPPLLRFHSEGIRNLADGYISFTYFAYVFVYFCIFCILFAFFI